MTVKEGFERWRKSKGYRSQTVKNTALASYKSKKEGFVAGDKNGRKRTLEEIKKISHNGRLTLRDSNRMIMDYIDTELKRLEE